jgi:O-antigen/teichoic acid export membrane protein
MKRTSKTQHTRSFSADVAVTLAAKWVALGLTVASGVVVARCLGPERKGLLILTFMLLNQTILLGSFGIPQALVYFLASGQVSPAEALGHYIVSSGIAALLLTAPYAAVVYGAGEVLFKGVPPSTLFAAGLLIFPSLLLSNAGGVLRGLGRLDLFNVLRFVEAFVGSVTLIAALYVARGSLTAAVLATFVATVAAGFVALGLVVGAVRRVPRWNPRSFGPLLRYGLQSYFTVVLQLTERKIDMFMLGYFLSAETAARQIGIYAVAVSLAELPRSISAAVSVVLLPSVSASDPTSNHTRVPRVSRHLIAVNVAFGGVLALFAGPLIRLFYGPAFLPSFVPFLILVPGVVMAAVWNVFQVEMLGTGHPMRLSMFAGLTLGLNVALNLVAIPRWGILGAAMTSGLTYSLLAFLLLYDYRSRHREVPLRQLVLVSRAELKRWPAMLLPLRPLRRA